MHIYICTYIYIHTYVGQNNAEKNQKNTPPIYIYIHVCVGYVYNMEIDFYCI